MVFLPNSNSVGFDAVPCNGPLKNYQDLIGDVTQEQRSIYYMTGRDKNGVVVVNRDVTTIYPWRRDITATSNWNTPGLIPSYRDLCTSPNGVPVEGVTGLGVRVYKAPIVGLPPLNNLKCADCLNKGQNCGNCQGVY